MGPREYIVRSAFCIHECVSTLMIGAARVALWEDCNPAGWRWPTWRLACRQPCPPTNYNGRDDQSGGLSVDELEPLND